MLNQLIQINRENKMFKKIFFQILFVVTCHQSKTTPETCAALFKQLSTTNRTIDEEFLQAVIETYNIEIIVETGTLEYESLQRTIPQVREVYLIRNNPTTYVKTAKLFKNNHSVHVYPGPSADSLSLILPFIKGKVLFILGCATEEEAQTRQYNSLFQDIRSIIACSINDGVILINNMQLLRSYPTEHYVRTAVLDINGNYSFQSNHHFAFAYLPS